MEVCVKEVFGKEVCGKEDCRNPPAAPTTPAGKSMIPAGQVVALPVTAVTPNPAQPRRRFDEEPLLALSSSIAENGLLQPITVRQLTSERYELIAGERRLMASRLAGRTTIPAIVVQAGDSRSATLALLENLQRENLTVFEQAEAFRRLIEQYGYTQEGLARKLGMSQPAIANKLRLLALSREVRAVCEDNGLSERHARALLRLDKSLRLEAVKSVAKRKLNVAQTESYVDTLLKQRKPILTRRTEVKDARIFLNTVNKTVDTIRRMGIPVETSQNRGEGFVEFTMRIPIKENRRA